MFSLFILLVVVWTVVMIVRYQNKLNVYIQPRFAAWDGKTVYVPGQNQIPFEYKLVELKEKVSQFAIDQSGNCRIFDSQSPLKFKKAVRDRMATKSSKARGIPSHRSRSGVVKLMAKVSTLNPDANLDRYAEKWGIIVIYSEGLGTPDGGSITLGDDVKIPY
jgi:hypothetical protein